MSAPGADGLTFGEYPHGPQLDSEETVVMFVRDEDRGLAVVRTEAGYSVVLLGRPKEGVWETFQVTTPKPHPGGSMDLYIRLAGLLWGVYR